MRRMPQAKVHRYEKASHLLAEDYDIATPIFSWLGQNFGVLAEGTLQEPVNAEAAHRKARQELDHLHRGDTPP